MQNSYKKRICIVCRSLSEGGADRVAAMQSIFLSNLGYKVYIVTILDAIAFPYKGNLLNLGQLKAKDNSVFGRFKRLLVFKRFLKKNAIDFVIDHRVRTKVFSEYILSGFVYPKRSIYVVHSHAINLYFPPLRWLTKILYNKALAVVCVTEGIAKKVEEKYDFKQVKCILNPVDFEYIDSAIKIPFHFNSDYIFWYGRLENESKNLFLLLESYKLSKLPLKQIKLLIMGHGKDALRIQNKISTLKLKQHVQMLPFSQNPFSYLKHSKFMALSSQYEGFPMAIIEALACGVPVVSVKYNNYHDGVIQHNTNGLWVENHNPEALAKGLNLFIEDEKLYFYCKENSKTSVSFLDVNIIAKQWQQIIEN